MIYDDEATTHRLECDRLLADLKQVTRERDALLVVTSNDYTKIQDQEKQIAALTQRVKELEGYLTAASQRHANIFAEYYAKAEHEPLLEEVQNLKQLLLTEQQARQELWNSIVERGKAVTPTTQI